MITPAPTPETPPAPPPDGYTVGGGLGVLD